MIAHFVTIYRKEDGSLSLEQALLLAGGIVAAQLTLPPLFGTLATYLQNFSMNQ